ncbi:MAG: 5-formyltetrahydrofolate cyclo-ligase [Deltaproteobacteria bacterium]|nr:5-formyltetrahydrofolate cyclo-ligase [Deltaproteobacteria bacterium]
MPLPPASSTPVGTTRLVDPVAELKRRLRDEMSLRRQACTSAFVQTASAALAQNLLTIAAFKNAGTLAGFQAIRREIDPDPALLQRQRTGAVLAWPRVAASRPRLMFHRTCRPRDWTQGPFGLREPVASAPVVPIESLNAILVPGLAFDRTGARLGWGGGFYDEALGRLPPLARPLLLGVGFDFQIVARCPVEPLDVFVDWVVTDQQVIRCANSKPLTERSS